jgi:hypothetical protein
MSANTPVDSTEAREHRAEFPETLSVRCRATRPEGVAQDGWTEPNVLAARAYIIGLGVAECRADGVLLAMAADATVISPRAVSNARALKRARGRAAGRLPGRSLPPWCGRCPPEGRFDPSRRWFEDDEGHPYKCPDCHPAIVQESPHEPPKAANA